MKTLAEFKAEQQQALEKATAAHAVKLQHAANFAAHGVPIPDYFGGLLYGANTISYSNSVSINGARGMRDAVALFKTFADGGLVVPFHVLRDGCTLTHPENRLPAKEGARRKRDTGRHSADFAAWLKIDRVEQNTRAGLCFFADMSGALYRIGVDFGRDYIGMCSALSPVVRTERGHRDQVIARRFEPCPALNGAADAWLNFGSGDMGPIKTSSSHYHLFVTDHADEERASCGHAIEMLGTVADHVDGTAP